MPPDKDDSARPKVAPGSSAGHGSGADPKSPGDTHNATPALPPLQPAEFKRYNGLAERMDHFHNQFRRIWNLLYSACEKNKRPANMTLAEFIEEGILFCDYLTAHHSIEEVYLFPKLARKMPQFSKAGTAELLAQHRVIHAGMDVFSAYLGRCKRGEEELRLSVLKAKMDTWGETLWRHMDDEVEALGAENMRKYWTLQEMAMFPA